MKLKELLLLIDNISKKSKLSTPYVCGGVARDFYMKRLKKISDIDITTGDKTIFKLVNDFYKEIAPKYKVSIKQSSDKHSTIDFTNISIDFSSNFIYEDINSLIKTKTDLEKETYSRDFTCNSLLANMAMTDIIDVTNRGIKDINNKIVSTILDPEITLTRHKNRVVRSIYIACNLGFELDPKIIKFVKENPSSFNLSTKNVVKEKLILSFEKDPTKASRLLEDMGLWDIIPISDEIKPFYVKYKGLK